jgi:type II secretory pathway pseudopilin PulG
MFAGHKGMRRQRGTVLVLAMIFLVIFSALAVALATSSGTNVQAAANQQHVNGALHAAQSGLECAKYIVSTATLDETYTNTVTTLQANKAWADLCAYIQSTALDGKPVPAPSRFTDSLGQGDQIVTQSLGSGTPNVQFTVRFYRYDSDPRTVQVTSFGTHGNAARRVGMGMLVTKDREVLRYGLASRGRIWLTGDTTIHGDVFSTWNRAGISPFNLTSDSAVRGTVNTVRTLSQIQNDTFQFETLNDDGVPIDINGNPLADNYAERYHGPADELQGYHEGVNYGQPYNNMPGMDISDYNTDLYTPGLTTIPAAATSSRITEYFPHAAGNYSQPRAGGSTSFTRHVYENQTFTNALLPMNRHALFRNCTFQEVLYVDCSQTNASRQYANNVRFENCTFNGVIVTDVPQPFNWVNNCLYFTGSATFNNQSSIQEATILAPHFNVNLGNANPQQSDNNVLTGAIVGGIVDVRGNAQVNGTIISMANTTMYTSGYVTNIGATLNDGGSETTELGDIGTINITPEEDTMLPSGISSPIVIKPDLTTYSEGF